MIRVYLGLVALSAVFFSLSLLPQVQGLWGIHGLSPLAGSWLGVKLTPGLALPLVISLCFLSASLLWVQIWRPVHRLQSVFWLILFLGVFALQSGGGAFLSFQWDLLLLEVCFLCFLLTLFPKEPSVIVWAGRICLFKLMFLSGLVKLTSGDPLWASGQALDYHFWTQPLPTSMGLHVHHFSDQLKIFMSYSVLVIEGLGAFLVFGGKRIRQFAFLLFAFLQIWIQLTGNYGFFNLLSFALSFFLLMDAPKFGRIQIRNLVPISVATALSFTSLLWCVFQIPGTRSWIEPLTPVLEMGLQTRTNSPYGLFAVMTNQRIEVRVEASQDQLTWEPFVFHWKVDEPTDCGAWIAPHQPRLDWQMWFLSLSLGSQEWPARNIWFLQLLRGLGQQDKAIESLMKSVPYPDQKIALIRVRARQFQPTPKAGSECWSVSDWKEILPPMDPWLLKLPATEN